MKEVFQRHLRPLDKKAYQILDCQIFQTRHQQARWTVQYVLHLAEPGTGRSQRQWVTGMMCAEDQTRWARMKKRWLWWMRERLRRFAPRRGIVGTSPAFAPFYYIPDLDMLVQVFPYDRQLPALPLLIAGPPTELEPLLLARFGSGDWQTESWDAEPVRYLAEKRATLRLTVRARHVTTGRTEEKRFYAKVYHDEEKGKQTYEVLRTLWENASAGGEGFTVGRLVAYLSDLRALIQEEVTGTSLQDMLHRGDDVTPAVRRVARALAALHLDSMTLSQRRPLQREVNILGKAGELIQGTCPHLKSEIEEIIGTIVAGLEEVPPVPSHCDFLPAHIVFDGDHLVLLDLDEFAGADPLLDVTRLLSPLANAPLRYPLQERDRARMAARAFVQEYFTCAPKTWRTRLPLYYAIAVLKMAGAISRRRASGACDEIETLVGEARDSLAGKVW
jgi:hypothetical protein